MVILYFQFHGNRYKDSKCQQQLASKSVMRARIQNWLRGVKEGYREDKIMKLWQSKKYDQLVGMFKKIEDYNSFRINDYPFLYFLINEKDKQAVETLLKKLPYRQQILEDISNPMGVSPICYAFLQGNQEIVDIIEKNGGNLFTINKSAQSILHLAAIYKRLDAFNKAISHNQNINLQDEFGNTAFHYAARVGSPEMTSTMIAANAKKLENHIYQYPIHMAIESRSQETFELLKNDVTDVYPKFHPIHSASRSGSWLMAKKILNVKPACLNIKDFKGLTPLHHAVIIEDIDMVKALVAEPGILINEVDVYGNTPLHLAFINENMGLCRILLEKKASLDVVNQDNLTPVDYGISSTNKAIHTILYEWQEKNQKIREWTKSKL